MPFPNWNPTEDADPFDGPALQAKLSGIWAAANDIESTATLRHTLGRNHLASPVFTPAYRDLEAAGGPHLYTNTYPGWNTNTIGSPGWAVINDGVADMEATFSAPVDLLGNNKIGGVLVEANIHVYHIGNAATTEFSYAYFVLQMRFSDGTSRLIPETECYEDAETNDDGGGGVLVQVNKEKDVPLEYLITAADIPAGKQLSSVRVLVCVRDGTGGGGAYTRLYRGNISALPMQAGSL